MLTLLFQMRMQNTQSALRPEMYPEQTKRNGTGSVMASF